MNDVVLVALLVVSVLAAIGVVVFAIVAFASGHIDGSLDFLYPHSTQRENDRFNGVFRALYEIGYGRGQRSELRVATRRAERERGEA